MSQQGFRSVISGTNILDDVTTIDLHVLHLLVPFVGGTDTVLGIEPPSGMTVVKEDVPDRHIPGLPEDSGRLAQGAVGTTVTQTFLSRGGMRETFQMSRSSF